MGNTCKRCFGIRGDSRKFIRAKYTMTKDFSIEFENLVEEDIPEEIVRPVTEHEKRLVKRGILFQLVAEQARRDLEIDEKLAAQEEALKVEEEAYYAERRAASANARRIRLGSRCQALAVAEDPLQVSPIPASRSDWSDVELDDDYSLVGSSKVIPVFSPPSSRPRKSIKEEMEEEERRASMSAAHSRLLNQRLNQGFGDFQSVSSGREASIDLDWDHEPGMNPALAEGMERSATEEDLTRMATCSLSPRLQLRESPVKTEEEEEEEPGKEDRGESPASLVWENDFTMDVSRRHLLAEDT